MIATLQTDPWIRLRAGTTSAANSASQVWTPYPSATLPQGRRCSHARRTLSAHPRTRSRFGTGTHRHTALARRHSPPHNTLSRSVHPRRCADRRVCAVGKVHARTPDRQWRQGHAYQIRQSASGCTGDFSTRTRSAFTALAGDRARAAPQARLADRHQADVFQPSSQQARRSLTVWDCVSSHRTLGIMFWVALIMTPIIIAYTSWAYRVMRGKVTIEQIRANDRSSY